MTSLPPQQSSHLQALLKLYRPNVGRGNYMGDVSWRGANEMLKKVAVALGLASEDEMTAHFHRLDEESYRRSEARIAALEVGRTAATKTGNLASPGHPLGESDA